MQSTILILEQGKLELMGGKALDEFSKPECTVVNTSDQNVFIRGAAGHVVPICQLTGK